MSDEGWLLDIGHALTNEHITSLDIPPRESILGLKRQLEGPSKTPACGQKLLLDGSSKELCDDETLEMAGLAAGAKVLLVRIPIPVQALLKALSLHAGAGREPGSAVDTGLLMQYALDHSVDVNVVAENGDNMLMLAIQNAHLDACRLLLDHGLDSSEAHFDGINALTSVLSAAPGLTSLHLAAICQHSSICHLLLENRNFIGLNRLGEGEFGNIFPYQYQGMSNLHAAAFGGLPDVCQKLLAMDAFTEANVQMPFRGSALNCAVQCGHAEVCRVLLGSERFTAVHSPDGGEFNALVQAACCGNCHVGRMLLEDDRFDADTTDSFGRTALQGAATAGHVEFCSLLLASLRFTAINNADSTGATALHRACSKKLVQVCSQILKDERFSAHDLATKDGRTALHEAAQSGNSEICVMLLRHEQFTAVNALTAHGRSALHYAAERGMSDVCELILDDGRFEEANAKDDDENTAMQYASRGDHVETVKLLYQRGAW